jgi:hypothetical protein
MTVSLTHEAIVKVFQLRPELAPQLLEGTLRLRLSPNTGVQLEAADLTELRPTPYKADAVITLTGPKGKVVLVVEAQLDRNADKRFTWPVYLASARERARCPAILLVICPKQATATWCSTPIDLGHPGLRLVPLVVGPDQLRLPQTPDEVQQDPALALLTTMLHSNDDTDLNKTLQALLDGLSSLNDEEFATYADIAESVFDLAKRIKENEMTTGQREYLSDVVRRYISQGRVEGVATAVLSVLGERGFEISDAHREQITTCHDLSQCQQWLVRAIKVDSVEELLGLVPAEA